MILRLFGPTLGTAIATMAVTALFSSAAQAAGPEYTYIGISYEWTEVKYGLNPAIDNRFNNGTIEGENIDISLGILSWLHVQGQAFGYLDGICKNCSTDLNTGQVFDSDMQGYKVGVGVNLGWDLIGLSEKMDLVLRGNYIDTEIKNLSTGSPSSVDDNGWSIEAQIRGQISEKADAFVGYEYHELSDVDNRDLTIGLNYRVFNGLSVMTRAIIFDTETGFELGLRWQFGDLLLGRDSLFK